MFGISLPEMLVIAIIAVIALGPEKLPKAMVEIAKFFKVIKKVVNDAKSSFEQEVKIAELKEEAQKYKESFTKTGENIRKKLTFEELDEIKKNLGSAQDKLNETFSDIKSEISSLNSQNSTQNLAQNAAEISNENLEISAKNSETKNSEKEN